MYHCVIGIIFNIIIIYLLNQYKIEKKITRTKESEITLASLHLYIFFHFFLYATNVF